MNFVSKINMFYSRYLYIIVPIATLAISVMDLVFGEQTQIRILGYIFISILSAVFFVRYIKSKKKNEGYCLIQLTYLFIVSAMACGRLLNASTGIWIALSGILFFMIFFVMFYLIGRRKF